MSASAVVSPEVVAPAAAPVNKSAHKAMPFDIRLQTGAGASLRGIAAPATPQLRQALGRSASALAVLHKQAPGASLSFDSATAAPSRVMAGTVALSKPAPGATGEAVVRRFLSDNQALYGLDAGDLAAVSVMGESHSPSGLRMVRAEQSFAGKRVFLSETRFLLGKDGRVWRSLGSLVPRLSAAVAAGSTGPTLSAPAAAAAAMKAVGIEVDSGAFSSKSDGASPQADSVSSAAGARQLLATADSRLSGDTTAELGWFAVQPGLVVPAWRLITFTTGDADWYSIVDAQSGTVLWRKNMRAYDSTQDARFRVYVQADGTTPAESPAPNNPSSASAVPGSNYQAPAISPTIVSMQAAMDATASPNGWIDDCPSGGCTAAQTQTIGNNVHAYLDVQQGANANLPDTNAAGAIDGNGKPTGNPDVNSRNRDFLGTTPRNFETNYLPPPQGGNPEAGQTATGNGNSGALAIDQFRRGMLTNLFYLTNWYHDRTYELGFDEAAGNFQQTNFSGAGLGNDRVLAEGDDGSGTNNANFSTPPDGMSGRMQMYRFTGPTIDRDGSLDATIVLHEATHGLSNRLVGNGSGLVWNPAGGMGEGWSDFYALSLLNNSNSDDPDAQYQVGGYATYKLNSLLDNYVYGIRRFPYSTDHSINPLTWADADDVSYDTSGGITPSPLTASFTKNGAMEVHNVGELWANTLWGVRSRIIHDPAGANGDVPTGNHTMLVLVTDGLKMTPVNPSYTDARDAILAADCATNACANEDSIWGGFADRGLGYGASTPYNKVFGFTAGHIGVHESFEVPKLDVVDAATDVVVDDSIVGNNTGAADPGETVKLTVKLTNPWRSKTMTGATATLSTATPGVTIYSGGASYGSIAPQASGTGDAFAVALDPSLPCGSAIDFTLTTVSNLGTTATGFRLRVGGASGTDPVVTYTSDSSNGLPLAIPDNVSHGVRNQLAIADDLEISKLDFSIDSITHPFIGDLTAELRSPDGTGTDFMGIIGGLTDGGSGQNITNMVMDDDQPVDVAHDMVQATASRAPMTGLWLPVFNAPWTTTAGFGAPDAAGSLSRFKGKSSKGTWTVQVSDQFAADSGTLNQWSMQVTPVHFACTAFTADTTPNAFSFTGATNVPVGSTQTSNEVTLTGFNAPAPISFKGTGAYAVNGGAYTSADGTVLPGDKVKIQLTAASGFKSTVHGGVVIGGVAGSFIVTTVAADTTPDPIVFTALTGVIPGSTQTSNTVSISGLEQGYTATAISVTGGSYSLNNGTYTTAAGTVKNGDTVSVQQTASSAYQTRTTAALRVGTLSASFAVTTRAVDTTPDPIVFTAVSNASPTTDYTSNTVLVGGLEAGYTATPVSITGGQYDLNGNGFTTAAGTIKNGDLVTVKLTSAGTAATRKTATLKVGASSSVFAVTTKK